MSDDINCLKNRQSSQQTFTAHQFLLCNGLTHTNKHGTNSYKSIDYETICKMASKPESFDKEKGFATILSTYRRHDGRDHDVQREHGSYIGIAVDVDAGNCELQTLEGALSSIIGNVDHVIYSTSTAKVDDKKWRAIIPFAEPHPYSEIEFVTKALFDRLDEVLGGQVCDRKMENPGQVSFLPNVPFTHTKKGVTTKYRGDDGEPFFYEHQIIQTGQRFDLLNCSLTEQAKALQEWEVTNQAALAKQRESQAKALECVSSPQEGSPIDLFNQQFKVADLLIQYGYKEMDGRYLSPHQESGSPATVLSEDGMACFIHSESDIKEGIGRSSSQSSCNYADAFDLFTHYEHQGNQKAATRAAAKLLGLDRSSPADDFAEHTDLGTGEITLVKKSLLGDCVDLSLINLSAPNWVIDYLIPEGVGVIAGSPAVGKTTAIIPLAMAATGMISHLDKSIATSISRKVVIFSEDTEQVKRILFGIKEHLITKDNRRAK